MKHKKKKKNIFFAIIKVLMLVMFSIGTLGGVAFAGVALAIVKTAPDLDLSSILTLSEPSVLYDDKEQLMDEVATSENREVVAIKDVPKTLRDAFISIEDERFEKHNGIDIRRIFGAVWTDVQKIVKGQKGLHGASTITQQLLKNTLLTDDVTVQRKVQEMYLAMELEQVLNKDEILEAYINTIPLGGQIYGVQKASKHYFNKDVKNLNLIESAYIAGVTQWPSRYYAFTPKAMADPTEIINRTKTVLWKMYDNKYIDKETYDNSLSDLDNKKLVFEKPKTIAAASKYNYEWFSVPVMTAVREDLKKNYNLNNEEVEKLLMFGGLKIHTTMNRDLQHHSQKVMDDDKNIGITSKPNDKGIIQPQGSAVVMDYRTGEVKVIIGGRGQQPARSFNRAASNDYFRPTGSAIKPISVYSPAIDTKLTNAATVIEDSPLPEEIGKKWPDKDGNPYDPKNYETGYFQGYMTVREAIRQSVNLVAIKLEYQIGLNTGLAYAEKFGIFFDEASKRSISALSLGEFKGSNTLNMAAAYGVFANNGMYTSPILYRKVVDKTGKILLENKPTVRKVLSPQSNYIMYDLLKGPVTSGTATTAKLGNMPAAGKTGTSADHKDLWFCGVTPYYTGAVWLGNDMPSKLTVGGSYISAGLWGKIMLEAHKGLEVKDVERPSGISSLAVCRDSGMLPTELCSKDPRGSRIYQELFIDGTQPTTLCDTHIEVKISKNNGKLATEFTPAAYLQSKVFLRRDYKPSVDIYDQKFIAPTEFDDTKPPVTENTGNSITDIINNILNKNGNKNSNNNNSSNKD